MGWVTDRQLAQDRLPRLASWLRQISELVNGAKFNLDVYAEYGRGDHRVPPTSVSEAASCGFEGCALGWAALEPGFRDEGLEIKVLTEHHHDFEIFESAVGKAAEFFGVSRYAAEVIFGDSWNDWESGSPSSDPDRLWSDNPLLDPHDPIQAAERVERFCADNGINLPESAQSP